MNKADLVKSFQEAAGLSNGKARECFDALCGIMARELAASGEVPLPGIGKLVVKARAAREGRNPRTGETLTIPARRVLAVRPSKEFNDSLKA